VPSWGYEKPVYVVAEVGINASGDMSLAKQIIFEAYRSGANAVKFQKRTVGLVYTQEELAASRESPWGDTTWHQKMGIEFDIEQHSRLMEYARSLGLEYGVSPWDIQSANECAEIKPDFLKIASPMMTNLEVVRICRDSELPVIASIGMCTTKIINDAMYEFGSCPDRLAVLQCTSAYPAKTEDLNLRRIDYVRRHRIHVVGYSGHEDGIKPSVWAVAAGAKIVERHFTTDRNMYGSDQRLSLDPFMFRMMVDDIRECEKALGNSQPEILECERPAMNKLRRV
jgi:N-acetylneuraminate synthase